MLGLAGLGAPDAGQIVEEALAGKLDVLWVFGHDMVEFFGEGTVRELSEKVGLFVFSGTNANPTASFANWVLPTSGYVVLDLSAEIHKVAFGLLHVMTLSVDNAFDTEYRRHLNRVREIMPEPGRNVRVLHKAFF